MLITENGQNPHIKNAKKPVSVLGAAREKLQRVTLLALYVGQEIVTQKELESGNPEQDGERRK